MKKNKLKNIITITCHTFISYVLFSLFFGVCYIVMLSFSKKNNFEIEFIDIELMIIILSIVFIFIYLLLIIKEIFLIEFFRKKILKDASDVNMISLSENEYNRIIKNDCSKVCIRNLFIEKYAEDQYRIIKNLQSEIYYKSISNFYIGNESNELLYIVSELTGNVSYRSKKYICYSIFDPFYNEIGIIRKKIDALRDIYNVNIYGRKDFDIVFNLYKMVNREQKDANELLEIGNVPLKFNNEFFNDKYKINTNCTIINSNTNDLIAQIHDLGMLGNYDLDIIDNNYNLETICFNICLVLEKLSFDGSKVIMTNKEDKNEKSIDINKYK